MVIKGYKQTQEHKQNVAKAIRNKKINCLMCKEEFKPNSNFQIYCSKCRKINDKILHNNAKRKYFKKNKEKWRKYREDWRNKNPEKYKAEYLSYNKIKIPESIKCEICNRNLAKERHHPDYSEPLYVQFVCINCHRTKLNRTYKGDRNVV